MKIKNIKNNKAYLLKLSQSRGFALLFAIVISSILLAIALGVSNIAFKEVKFGSSGVDANNAFFAADTGVECALFNDKSVNSVFVSGGPSTLACNGGIALNGSFPVWNFTMTGLGSDNNSCVNVSVVKDNTDPLNILTTIIAKGHNKDNSSNCNSSNSNIVERVLEVRY